MKGEKAESLPTAKGEYLKIHLYILKDIIHYTLVLTLQDTTPVSLIGFGIALQQ